VTVRAGRTPACAAGQCASAPNTGAAPRARPIEHERQKKLATIESLDDRPTMGVMTDLLLARPDEAEAVAAEWPPQGRSRWADVEMKGQSPVTLGQLLAIIRDVEWTPEIFEDKPLASGGQEGPWVTAVPADFVAEAAGLDDDRFDQVAEAWSEIEEFEGWDVSEVRESLTLLRAFCRRARAEGSPMLMWMAL
jgi:hypothetical protein